MCVCVLVCDALYSTVITACYVNEPDYMVTTHLEIDWLIHYSAFLGSESHVALLLLGLIPGDLLSACPHRQFHTLPGLLDSWAALPNSNPNACVPMQGGSSYHFYDGLWYDPAGAEPMPYCVRGGHANH